MIKVRDNAVKDLTKTKYGKLQPTSYERVSLSSGRSVIVWDCECDCGTMHKAYASNLSSGNVKSCGCSHRLAAGESAFNSIYSSYKRIAISKGRYFRLTKKQFRKLVVGECYYCGDSLSNRAYHPKSNGSFKYTGIDRIDNSKGYSLSNSVSCCSKCNKAKLDRSINEYEKWIKQSYLHIQGRDKDGLVTSIV